MKIIISHDVDHLCRNDHYKDLIYPKIWVRGTLMLLGRKINIGEWLAKMLNPFKKEQNKLKDVMAFDYSNDVPSTFFFGMEQGLGMNYKKRVADHYISKVQDANFDVGVHGICFDAIDGIKNEYASFKKIINNSDFGIRMHYVRFNDDTFNYLDQCGYLFDTSEFDKKKGYLIKKPYKIDRMWEFPLTIMDGYLPHNLEEKKKKTMEIINEAVEKNIPYLTILFHDNQFCKAYQTEWNWYIWLINWIKDNGYSFISYRDAIRELEENDIL